jgi:hypothetical protein
MAINTGDLLMGLGAAVGGTGPQFIQGLEQRDRQATEQKRAELQARQQAMYQDAATGLQLFRKGDLDGLIALGEDRLQLLQTYPDADPSDTQRIIQLARFSKQGDPVAQRNLAMELTTATARGISMGLVQMPEAQKPEIIPGSSVVNGQIITQDAMGNLVAQIPEGFTPTPAETSDRRTAEDQNGVLRFIDTGEPVYPNVQQTTTSDEYSPGITRYRNGVAAQYSRQGNVRVVDEQGNVVTGVDAQNAIERGISSGVTEAGQVAVSQAQGKGQTERAQGIINAGVDAIAQFPIITRSLDLLDEVKTGGFAGAATRARAFFGVEGADEGELSYNLSMNVLQQLKPIFGAAFTAGEGQRLERIEASLGRSPETNKRLLKQALDIARTSADKALDRASEADDQATIRELQNALNSLDDWETDLSVPEDWVAGGGTIERWNAMPNEKKREYIRAK